MFIYFAAWIKLLNRLIYSFIIFSLLLELFIILRCLIVSLQYRVIVIAINLTIYNIGLFSFDNNLSIIISFILYSSLFLISLFINKDLSLEINLLYKISFSFSDKESFIELFLFPLDKMEKESSMKLSLSNKRYHLNFLKQFILFVSLYISKKYF